MARLIRAELPDPYQLVVRFRRDRDEPFLTWLLAQPVGQISDLIRTRLNDLAARGELGGVTPPAHPASKRALPERPAANDAAAKAGTPVLEPRLRRLMRNDDAATKDSHG